MAVGISAGSATRRRRSSGVLARCQMQEPMPLQVVSMPAISSSRSEPITFSARQRLAVELGADEIADQVVAGLLRALVHVAHEVVRHLAGGLHRRR